jgi:hypothetical protein
MKREWEAQRGALATVRRFNAIMSSKGHAWFWPTIGAALVSKHHWLVINCDSCGTVIDLDLRVKPRAPEASVHVALRDVQCPRCNGHGRPRVIALAQHASIRPALAHFALDQLLGRRLRPLTYVRFTPESGHMQCSCYGPKADIDGGICLKACCDSAVAVFDCNVPPTTWPGSRRAGLFC